MATNTVSVTACDNELIVMAYQWGGSFELFRILSGNNQAVDVSAAIVSGPYQGSQILNGVNQPLNQDITVTLPSGTYQMLFLGIDWGGPAQFTVAFNGSTYSYPKSNTGDGLLFNPGPVKFTVP